MDLMSASVDLLSEVFGFWDDLMDVIFGCSVVAVLLCFWDVIFIQDEVLYDVQFIITI